MTIEWNKIVGNAISALVVAVFLGAATIVWKGATSVDDKVSATREDMTHLISALSDKLGGYEVQITSLSNQLAIIIKQQQANRNVEPLAGAPRNPVATLVVPQKFPSAEVDGASRSVQQKAYSQDIMRQLKR